MSFWSAVVAIVAILAFTAMRLARYRAEGGATPPDALGPAREAALLREIDALRERVHVLERIATEDRQGKAIAAQIESLRDQ